MTLFKRTIPKRKQLLDALSCRPVKEAEEWGLEFSREFTGFIYTAHYRYGSLPHSVSHSERLKGIYWHNWLTPYDLINHFWAGTRLAHRYWLYKAREARRRDAKLVNEGPVRQLWYYYVVHQFSINIAATNIKSQMYESIKLLLLGKLL